jgi:hypothetical protein
MKEFTKLKSIKHESAIFLRKIHGNFTCLTEYILFIKILKIQHAKLWAHKVLYSIV